MNWILCKYVLRTLLTFTVVIPATTIKVVAASSVPIVQDSQNPHQLTNRARQLYQDEQYLEASTVWQQAVDVFREQGDILNQAMALSNLALTQQKLGDLTAAEKSIADGLKLLQVQSQTATQQRILANILDVKGSIVRSRGQSKIAWETWKQAEKIYQELDNNRAVVKNQINQAQALQDLGYYRRASKILQSVQAKLNLEPDSEQKVSALLSFGNILRATGNLKQSQVVLQQAGNIANQLEANQQKNSILLSLGNTIRALGNRVREAKTIQTINSSSPICLADSNLNSAITYYQQAADCYQQAVLSSNPDTKIKAQLNLLSLAVQNQEKEVIELINEPSLSSIPNLIATITTNLDKLPITRATIFDSP